MFYTRYFAATVKHDGNGDELVFLVGMPRSGSILLVQRLIDRLPITSVGEYPEMRRIFHSLPQLVNCAQNGPECVNDLRRGQIDILKQQYFDSLPGNRENIVIDKILGNFIRLGLIATLFPNARIIHAVRDKRAVCVSCYTNIFAHGLRFTYDLYWLGMAWTAYERLMCHWHDVLPLRMLDVSYESLVIEPVETTRAICQFLDIENTPVLSEHSLVSNSDINTASFWQARQPLYSTSVDAWQRFQAFLSPLEERFQLKPPAN